MIHAVIPINYHKYPSSTIIKHKDVLARVNKWTYVHSLNMKPHDYKSITNHVHKMTVSDISYEKKE